MYNVNTMAVSADRLFEEIINLKSVQQMKASVSSAIKYGAIVGGTTIISGILGGPMGLTAGGVISSCVAGFMSRGTLRSVPYILSETSPKEREKLTQLVRDLLISKHIYTLRDFVLSINSNEQLIEAIIQIIIMFLSEMGYNCYKT